MSGALILFYTLGYSAIIGFIVYCAWHKALDVKLILYILGIAGTELLIGIVFKNIDSILTLKWKDYLYIIINIGIFISLMYSPKHFVWKVIFIMVMIILLTNYHTNAFLLLIIANVEMICIFFRRKKYIKAILSEEDNEEGFGKDEEFYIYLNLTFVATYFLVVTIIFGSHFCMAGATGHHFIIGLKSYLNNEWTDISLIQKIEGIIMGSIFLSYLTDIAKKKLFSAS